MRLVHYSANPDLSLSRLYSVSQISLTDTYAMRHKPFGLWFSDDGEKENWKAWCENEEFHIEKLTNAYLAELDLTNIRQIRTKDELIFFHGKYFELLPYSDYGFINWQKVAQDYKGIIISPYQWELRYDVLPDNWYYGWDVACGCIWDMSAIKSFEKIKGD